MPAIEGIDVAQGLARVNGNTTLYLRILRKFRDSHHDAAARIRVALDHGDYDSAMLVAHTVAGAGGNIGATALFQAARDVEAACRARAPIGQIGLQTMEVALAALTKALARALDDGQDLATAAPAPAPDPALIATRLRELKARLDECDAAAGDTLDSLRTLLGSDSRLEQIGKHLGKYDFPAASAAAETLARGFGISLTSTG
jgi:HPt (histidine-containing phosphotransfer) domain-containing protein